MLGRLFGRGKDERSEAVCGECGRTLLAGEWTQRVTDDRGDETILCSLCGQAHPLTGGERLTVRTGTGATAVRRDTEVLTEDGTEPVARAEAPRPEARPEPRPEPRDQRGESDALWKAIKDRDAEIERLTGELAHAEAQRQELLGTVARLKQQLAGASTESFAPLDEAVAETRAADEPGADEGPAGDVLFDREPADEAFSDRRAAVDEQPTEPASAAEAPGAPGPQAGEDTADEAAAEGLAMDQAGKAAAAPGADEPEAAGPDAAELEADAASLTLLQRGVDLLNVSTVPRKVAETTADLGLPGVHVAFDGQVVAATFLWNMGWYRYSVELESGAVRLDERGYDERDDLRPNGTVRGDGTVQLAPAQISRAAVQRLQQHQQPRPPAKPEEPEEAPAPAAPPVGGPEILSKSLLGQRTDDEPPSWEQTRARDFTWD